MTTIVYKEGIIAFDSRVVSDGIIVSDDSKKYCLIDGVAFFYAGATSDSEKMISAYLHGVNKLDSDVDGNAIVLDDGKLYFIGVTTKFEMWKCPIDLDGCYAIGSGREFAFAFMDSGFDAFETVKMVSKRDIYTGGTVRRYSIETGQIITY